MKYAFIQLFKYTVEPAILSSHPQGKKFVIFIHSPAGLVELKIHGLLWFFNRPYEFNVFYEKNCRTSAILLNHWLMIFSPSDPSSVGLAWAFLLQVGIVALLAHLQLFEL